MTLNEDSSNSYAVFFRYKIDNLVVRYISCSGELLGLYVELLDLRLEILVLGSQILILSSELINRILKLLVVNGEFIKLVLECVSE